MSSAVCECDVCVECVSDVCVESSVVCECDDSFQCAGAAIRKEC